MLELGESGLVGGYLILNTAGRPLEFHCTAPVRANRAQEILYGPTLKPFLYGEQIGQTLLQKSQVEPVMLCTDVPPMLAVREFTTVPVACLVTEAGSSAGKSLRVDAAHAPAAGPHRRLQLGHLEVQVAAGHAQDAEALTRIWTPYQEALDLREPFGRIRDAIEETQRTARP